MRQLHPVSFHERFVASGTYTVYDGDAPNGDIERWTLHEPGTGSLTIRADYQGEAGGSANWLFEGLAVRADEGWRVERYDLLLLGANQRTEAKLVFSGEGVDISTRVNGDMRDNLRIESRSNFFVATPALVSRFWFLRHLPQSNASLDIFEPEIDFAEGVLHGGRITTISIEALDQPAPMDRALAAASRGFCVRKPDGAASSCWVNADWIPVYYESSGGQSARLSEYTHRPEQSR